MMTFEKPACRDMGAEDPQGKPKSVRNSGLETPAINTCPPKFLLSSHHIIGIITQATVFWAQDYMKYWLAILFSLPGSCVGCSRSSDCHLEQWGWRRLLSYCPGLLPFRLLFESLINFYLNACFFCIYKKKRMKWLKKIQVLYTIMVMYI